MFSRENTFWNLSSKSTVFFWYSSFMCRNFWIKINDYWKKDLMWTEWDTFLQVAMKSNLYWINENLSFYRKHWNNTSNSLEKTLPHYEYLINIYEEKGLIDDNNLKKIKIWDCMMRCISEIKNKNCKKFIYYFTSAFKTSILTTISYWTKLIRYRWIRPLIFWIFSKFWH